MIKINFFGDFISKDPEQIVFSPEIEDLLQNSALNIVNFEAPVKRNQTTSPIPKSGPSLCQSEKTPAFLEKMGFNVISFANNHIMDYGPESCEYSKTLFSTADVIGVGTVAEAYKPHYYSQDGVKIGIVALAQQEFGALDISGNINYGYAWVNHPSVPLIISSAKDRCDFLFVFCHCGIEDINIPLPEWRAIYKSFIDYGADAVIASHPHRVQGFEYYNEHPIFYSIGNFFFDKEGLPAFQYQGIIASIIIDDEKKLSTDYKYVEKNGNNIIIDEAPVRLEELNKLLEVPGYQQAVDRTTIEMMPQYMHYYRISVNGFSSIWKVKEFLNAIRSSLRRNNDAALLLNSIRCESHRYLFSRGLKLLSGNSF